MLNSDYPLDSGWGNWSPQVKSLDFLTPALASLVILHNEQCLSHTLFEVQCIHHVLPEVLVFIVLNLSLPVLELYSKMGTNEKYIGVWWGGGVMCKRY